MQMIEYTIEVYDMSCEGCETLLERELTRLSGVMEVNADAITGEVAVMGEPRTRDQVRRTVAEIGYEPGRVE